MWYNISNFDRASVLMSKVDFKKIIFTVLKLSALGLLVGTFGGMVGAAFSHLLSFVNKTRETYPWIILLLPLGGIVTVALYQYFGISNNGTNTIILSVRDKTSVKAVTAPLIFICTAITHLLGGSAGKEGAALQLGGAGAFALTEPLKLNTDEKTLAVKCGMASVFAAVFSTPLTAVLFVLEFREQKKDFAKSVLPVLVSSILAAKLSSLLGVGGESFHKLNTLDFNLLLVGKIVLMSLALTLLSVLMCYIFKSAGKLAERLIANPFIRTIVGSVLIILITAIIGSMRYSGSGMELVIEAIEGESFWFDFALKLLLTALTIAAGFKGGEIVPTFAIGATFASFFGGLIGLDPKFAAALGLVGLFCAATNSLLGAVLLSVELFSVSALPYFIILCAAIIILSPKKGLFENRFFHSPIYFLRQEQK